MAKGHRKEQLDAMRAAAMEKYTAQREARFEDFMDLVSMGSGVEEAAARVGATLTALNRQAYRHGRHDIGRLTNMARYL
jgi:hypothetical protein